jgi:hypothetical protein
MRPNNTTSQEDSILTEFENGRRVKDLLDIVERMDAVIDRWKEVTGHDTPDEYENQAPEP